MIRTGEWPLPLPRNETHSHWIWWCDRYVLFDHRLDCSVHWIDCSVHWIGSSDSDHSPERSIFIYIYIYRMALLRHWEMRSPLSEIKSQIKLPDHNTQVNSWPIVLASCFGLLFSRQKATIKLCNTHTNTIAYSCAVWLLSMFWGRIVALCENNCDNKRAFQPCFRFMREYLAHILRTWNKELNKRSKGRL